MSYTLEESAERIAQAIEALAAELAAARESARKRGEFWLEDREAFRALNVEHKAALAEIARLRELNDGWCTAAKAHLDAADVARAEADIARAELHKAIADRDFARDQLERVRQPRNRSLADRIAKDIAGLTGDNIEGRQAAIIEAHLNTTRPEPRADHLPFTERELLLCVRALDRLASDYDTHAAQTVVEHLRAKIVAFIEDRP